MGREIQSRRIGPHTYRVKPLGARANTAALQEVLRVFGPALGVGSRSFVEGGNLLEGLLLAGAGGMGELIAQLPQGAVWELVERFGKGAEVEIREGAEVRTPVLLEQTDGETIADGLWAGKRYADMFAWLGFALEVNYASFFDDNDSVKTLLARARAAFEASPETESPSESRSESPTG